MAKKTDPIESMNYEQAQQALDEVIVTMEEGQADLEGSVALFERGKKLIQHCQFLLNEAELKVSQLEADGSQSPVGD